MGIKKCLQRFSGSSFFFFARTAVWRKIFFARFFPAGEKIRNRKLNENQPSWRRRRRGNIYFPANFRWGRLFDVGTQQLNLGLARSKHSRSCNHLCSLSTPDFRNQRIFTNMYVYFIGIAELIFFPSPYLINFFSSYCGLSSSLFSHDLKRPSHQALNPVNPLWNFFSKNGNGKKCSERDSSMYGRLKKGA